jgi:Ca2+-binding EF-hand superfamily protein
MSFQQDALKYLNDFRKKPSSFIDALEKVKLNLGQMSKNSKTVEFIKDIDSFIPIIAKSPGLTQFTLSKELTAAANKKLDDFAETSVQYNMKESEVANLVKKFCEGFTALAFLVNDIDDADSVLTRMIFANSDKEKKNRKALLDTKFAYIGIAQKMVDGDNYVVLLLADNVEDSKPKQSFQGLEELRQAFDFFDVNESGKINIKETLTALKSLGYHNRNPALFAILNELDTTENDKKGVDWDNFSNHVLNRISNVTSREGLRRIFDIFIDDPVQDTVTLTTLKRICRELGEPIKNEELQDMIQRAASNGVELTFDEFYSYMTSTARK